MKKTMITKISMVLVLIFCLNIISGNIGQFKAYANNVSVYINGNIVVFDQQPIIENGRLLVPVRTIAERLGSFVEWDEKNQTIIIQRGLDTAVFKINEKEAYANDIQELDVAPKILNGRTLIPLRAVSEIFGAQVEWDGETQKVNITCQQYNENDILTDFKNLGFYKFDYFRETFLEKHVNNPLYPWLRVFSEIGEWGSRIVSMPWNSYEKECYKEVIELILNSTSISEISQDVDTLPSWYGEVIKGIKYGLEIDFDKLKKEHGKTNSDIKEIEEAVKNYGRIKNLIKWSNFTLEEINYLYTDYSHNIKYLNSILYSLNASESSREIEKATMELIDEYTNKWAGIVNDGGQLLVEFLSSKAIETIETIAGKGKASLYGITTFAIETIMGGLGVTKYADSVENSMIISMLSSRLMFKFDEMLSYFNDYISNNKNGVTSFNWNEFVTLFDITKATFIELYTCMSSVTQNSAEKLYLQRQIDILKSIKISQSIPASTDDIFYYENTYRSEETIHPSNDIVGAGNMHSGSLATSDGVNIYTIGSDGIYKMDMNCQNKEKLCSIKGDLMSLNVYNNYLYAVNNIVYKVPITGGTPEELFGTGYGNKELQIDDGYIFYCNGVGYVYRASVDNISAEHKLLLNYGHGLVCHDGWLYYNSKYGISKIDYNGENKQDIVKGEVDQLNIYNDKMYYVRTDDEDFGSVKRMICSSDIDGSNEKVLYEYGHYIVSLNVYNNHIYFCRHPKALSGKATWNRMSLNGENIVEASKNPGIDISIAGGWFFSSSNKNMDQKLKIAKYGEDFK